jgi:1-acyl-sn-glycerol-3-phosphate acyltransferase
MDLRVPFAPGENFLQNFLRLLGGPSFEASVHFLAPVPLNDDGRRQTAEAARSAIAHALGYADA